MTPNIPTPQESTAEALLAHPPDHAAPGAPPESRWRSERFLERTAVKRETGERGWRAASNTWVSDEHGWSVEPEGPGGSEGSAGSGGPVEAGGSDRSGGPDGPDGSVAPGESRAPDGWGGPAALPNDASGAWNRDPDPGSQAGVLHWKPTVSLRERVRRAVGTPVGVGLAVFVVAVVVAIVLSLANSRGAVPPGDEIAARGAIAQEFGSQPDAAVDALEPAAVVPGDGSNSGGAGETGGPDRGGAQGESLFVHVVGAIATPGLVELRQGARVADALDAAGGATGDAVLAGVNLARIVVDGEQILVPDAATDDAAMQGTPEPSGVAGTPGLAPGAPSGTVPGSVEAKIRLSTAAPAELEQLPRVGPAIAQRIIEWRTEHGPFPSVDALLDVPGIGAKTLDGFRDRVEP